jgi:hypothetical protein
MTSLYVQFDPRHDESHGENGVRYDQSDCLNCGSSESLSPVNSPLDGVDMDDNSYVVSEGGGYAVAPILHGNNNNNNNNSDGKKPVAAYASFDSTSDESNNYAHAPRKQATSTPPPTTTTMRSASSAASTSSQQLSTGQREWNSEHQTLAKSPQWYRFYPHLAALTQQFQETAFTYGRLIISERALPPEQRSIKPINIGGVAGGDKYVHNGILFKFATDPVVAQHKGKPIYLFGGTCGFLFSCRDAEIGPFFFFSTILSRHPNHALIV